MAENTTEVLVGSCVLAAAAGFLIYAGQIGDFGAGRGGAEMANYPASFRSSEGVLVGTDVRMSGVKIGSVTQIVLNPETYRADANLQLDAGVLLPDDTAAVIASEGLLGGSFVELLPGGSPFYLEPGDEIEDTEGAVSLVQLLLRFVSGSGDQ